jgi:CheY-like chemotaxis protein
MRELLTAMLTLRGAEVKACGSATEALEAVGQWRPSILISDIGMPNDDGYTLIRKLRSMESDRNGHIPAVALTGFARSEDRLRALAAGFHMHVPKPVEAVELIMVIASLTGRLG